MGSIRWNAFDPMPGSPLGEIPDLTGKRPTGGHMLPETVAEDAVRIDIDSDLPLIKGVVRCVALQSFILLRLSQRPEILPVR